MVAVVTLALTACGTTKSSSPYNVGTELKLTMNDLEFLGESEISCEYDTYLGFIHQISKINGEDYVPGNDVKLSLPQGLYPEATYFIKVMDTKDTDVMFLGSTTKRIAKIRAYKFKK